MSAQARTEIVRGGKGTHARACVCARACVRERGHGVPRFEDEDRDVERERLVARDLISRIGAQRALVVTV
eukprot:1283670-Pleurochrysis_carterae.AAC.1